MASIKVAPSDAQLQYQKDIIDKLTKSINLTSETKGMDIFNSKTTLIVMIAWSDDKKRRQKVGQHLKRDADLFDQTIVVTNESSWNTSGFKDDYLWENWDKKIHVRIYSDNQAENAGLMRYRCFHAANEVPDNTVENQIVLIRDDRRFIYALKGPMSIHSIPESDPKFKLKFTQRLENIRTGAPMPTFSKWKSYPGLQYNEIMSIPGQQSTGPANEKEPKVVLKKEQNKNKKVIRNSSSDFSALTQGLFITLPTIKELWHDGFCYPPGPILEDYFWADMLYNAKKFKVRKAATFSLRTGDFKSIARVGDTQRTNDSPIKASTCWSELNASLAVKMADGLLFKVYGDKILFNVGPCIQEFSMVGNSRGGGAFHTIAASLALQDIKKSVLEKQGKLKCVESNDCLDGTIFEKYGVPDYLKTAQLVRATSVSEYVDIHNKFLRDPLSSRLPPPQPPPNSLQTSSLKKRTSDELDDDRYGDELADYKSDGEIGGDEIGVEPDEADIIYVHRHKRCKLND